MPGRAEGKVAFITGAGRGQGRSHAVRLAQEGADIIAIDICHDVPGALPMATPDDLAETVKLVEAQDRRIIATQADVRDFDAVKAAVDGWTSWWPTPGSRASAGRSSRWRPATGRTPSTST
jgi:(+)-trans-carveol dehydrogenase